MRTKLYSFICISNSPTQPDLQQTTNHLVGFIAIVLFDSTIVMVAYALSGPLSDRAQGAKRNLARTVKMPKRSSLLRQAVSYFKISFSYYCIMKAKLCWDVSILREIKQMKQLLP